LNLKAVTSDVRDKRLNQADFIGCCRPPSNIVKDDHLRIAPQYHKMAGNRTWRIRLRNKIMGSWRIRRGTSKFDEFVKSQIGSLGRSFSGVSSPAAKFQELVASSSNSLEFLTQPDSKPLFRKGTMTLPNPTYYETVKFIG